MSESKKPRICEVLGVRVGEEWTVTGDRYDTTYRISRSGNLQRLVPDGKWIKAGLCSESLTNAINNPESLIHKRRWTPEDIADAEAIRRLYPGSKFVRRVKMSSGTFATDIVRENGMATWIEAGLVPSLEVGEKVALDDILKVRE